MHVSNTSVGVYSLFSAKSVDYLAPKKWAGVVLNTPAV